MCVVEVTLFLDNTRKNKHDNLFILIDIKINMKRGIFLILFLVLISLVSAHQPRLVSDVESSIENPIIILNPEVSQAFYGTLKGNPDYYLIDSDKNFNLYVNILSPDVKDARQDFIVIILKDNIQFATLNSTNWTRFYEEFAGDWYFRGKEFEEQVEKGKYAIIVSNSNNIGKYSLAIGKIESFPFNEQVKTIIALPKLKVFFERSPFTAFFNLIGLFLFVLLVIACLVIWLIVFIIRKVSTPPHKPLSYNHTSSK